jgi:hypothetical protein
VVLSPPTPGGVPDARYPPLPAFTITPAATIDEGNNWINMFYGPLSLTCAITPSACGAVPFNGPVGNYTVPAGPGAHFSGTTYPNP